MNRARPCARCGFMQRQQPTGSRIVGREILYCYEEDTEWYVAVVVKYDERSDEHRLVYRADETLQTTRLVDGRWLLLPRHRPTYDNRIFTGAIIEFTYPKDGKRHRAMVFDHSASGDRIKIAYLNEMHTDKLFGGGWDFVTQSPCVVDSELPY